MAAVRPPSALLALLTCLYGASGCARPSEPHLLDLSGLTPILVEPGVTLAVEGEGFPAGRAGAVRLRGVLHRPGSPPLPTDRTFEGRAVSPDRFEVAVTDARVQSLGGRGTFRGAVELRFEGADGGASVSGLLSDAELDVLPSAERRLLDAPEQLLAARTFVQRAGFALAEEQPDEGARIGAVDDGGPAARAGLVQGACIEAIEGVRIADLADLRPPPDADEAVLSVRWPDELAAKDVRLRFDRTAADRRDAATPLAIASLTLLALFLLLVAPTARWTASLVRRPTRDAGGEWRWLLGGPAQDPSRAARLGQRVLPVASFVLGTSIFAALAKAGTEIGTDGLALVLLLALTVGRMLVAVASADPLGGALLRAALGAAGTLASVTGAALLTAARSSEASAWPWHWRVFESPVGLLLFAAFTLTALGPVRPGPGAPRPARHAARLHLVLAAALGVELFFGGWRAPGAPSPGGAWGTTWYVVQSWGLVALGVWARWRFPALDTRGHRVSLPLALLGLAATLAWLAWPTAEAAAAISGPFLCATTVTTVLVLVGRHGRDRGVELHLHPFL